MTDSVIGDPVEQPDGPEEIENDDVAVEPDLDEDAPEAITDDLDDVPELSDPYGVVL